MAKQYLLLQDGSKIILEDGTGALLLNEIGIGDELNGLYQLALLADHEQVEGILVRENYYAINIFRTGR